MLAHGTALHDPARQTLTPAPMGAQLPPAGITTQLPHVPLVRRHVRRRPLEVRERGRTGVRGSTTSKPIFLVRARGLGARPDLRETT